MSILKEKLKTTFFLTDGGLETDLIFNKGIDLPHFAAFPLVEDPKHSKTLTDYYQEYLELAINNNTGFILESPTWRANKDWAYTLGYSENDLIRANAASIEQLKTLREAYKNSISNIFISGQIGPRGDGYTVENAMTSEEAKNYHDLQIKAFKNSGADLVSAITMTYIDEAIGITEGARTNNIPVVISFTVETDGSLPSDESLKKAIETIDKLTDSYPLYYMINCAHPSHFFDKLKDIEPWTKRIQGVRANASCKSHAELDEATELDTGDVVDFGHWHKKLNTLLPNLKVYGGCCGTDASHVSEICNHINDQKVKV